MTLSTHKQITRTIFNDLAGTRHIWKEKNAYYYDNQLNYLKFLIPEGKKILELGCGTGETLASLAPSSGTGIDIADAMIEKAQQKYPHCTFITADAEDATTWNIQGSFDYILISDTIGHLEDIQRCFETIRPYCTKQTRIIITYHNCMWEPALKLAEKLRLKMPQKTGNWLSPEDITNLLYLSDFETVKTEHALLFLKKIPFLSTFINRLGRFPGIRRLCLCQYIVARMREAAAVPEEKIVSVVVPCRNEKGNIESAVRRTPDLGSHTEIIFVDGNSQDGTQEEIQRIIKEFPEKDITFMVQDKTGKGDAVRKGFNAARGDIFMILDADLTVPPEELPKFYHAIASGKGEFINGTRLVYPMEGEAMRFLNLLGNRFFSKVFSWLLNQRLRDTLCGTKVISREHYAQLVAGRSYIGDFDPFGDFDLLFGSSKLNLKILEIPIRYKAREYGETQISRFRHGLLLLRMCFFAMRKIKWK